MKPLVQPFIDETLGTGRALWYAPGNSNIRKTVMLAALILTLAIAIGTIFFDLQLDARGEAIWVVLWSFFVFTLGGNQRDEVRRRRKRRGEDDE